MDKQCSVQEVAKSMMETDTENENSDASDLEESPVSRALHQCCLTALTVMKMMVVAVDGWKKWTRNVACAAVFTSICHRIKKKRPYRRFGQN